jgi:hypothetical protein
MQPQSTNPLAKHFRQPAIYLTLPSGGTYWPDGSIELNMSNQIAVYPMTTKDEITIRTPDALLNGQSVISVIESCCPEIKDAWQMPSIDADAVLIAIRIASYGQDMDISTICPNSECKHENTNSLNLTGVLDTIRAPNYNTLVNINNLKIKLRPISYREGTKNNLSTFEEQQLLNIVNNDEISEEEKTNTFKKHLQRMVDLNMQALASSTESIETDEGIVVDNRDFILEFYNNADTKIIKAVREKLEEHQKTAALPTPKIKCEECETEYPVALGFDYANFFGNAS